MGTIQPPFTLYTLRVGRGIRNSPPEPAIYIFEEAKGRAARAHTLTPEQALELAGDLIEAARSSRTHVITDSDTGETLTPPLPHADATALVAATTGRNVRVQAVTA